MPHSLPYNSLLLPHPHPYVGYSFFSSFSITVVIIDGLVVFYVLLLNELPLQKGVVRVQAESEDFELKQMRDMAAARKRWEALVCEFNFIQLFGNVLDFEALCLL